VEETQDADAESVLVEPITNATEETQHEDTPEVEEEVEDTDTAEADEDAEDADEGVEDEDAEEANVPTRRQPPVLINYIISVLLIGFLPMVIGYVFAAAYDFVMNTINVQQSFPGFYPTLSLLSSLLPWRLAAQINLTNTNGLFIVFVLLWRIPDSVLGNPNIFDVQALEPLLFNAVALAILLFTMYGRASYESKPQAASWRVFIGLEALLGLTIILPSNLWLIRGLEGILQFQGQVIPLPPLQLLNTTMFILNLVTGVVFSVLVGLMVRRQYQLWTNPRAETLEEEDNLLNEDEAEAAEGETLETEQVL
jgi:hypothetical protein